MNRQLDPSHIMQTVTAFWASKVLLTAVELDLFSTLGGGALTAEQLGDTLKLHTLGGTSLSETVADDALAISAFFPGVHTSSFSLFV